MFVELTGVQPVTGGIHPGFGTRNRLVSLAPDVFFELIAPDPAQDITGKTRAREIAGVALPQAADLRDQTSDMAETSSSAAGRPRGERARGDEPDPAGRGAARLDSEPVRTWRLRGGGSFAIRLARQPHPSGTSPGGCP